MLQSRYLRVASRSLKSTRARRYLHALLSFVVAAVIAGIGHAGVAQLQYAPTLTTDRSAYAAGDEIDIAGTGFAPNETVSLTVTHDGGGTEPGAGHEPWVAKADEGGRLEATWLISAADTVEHPFVVRAVGAESGPSQSAPFVRTTLRLDAATYVAGDTVRIAGAEFSPGTAMLQIVHADGSDEPGMGHEPRTVMVQPDGTFEAEWQLDFRDEVGPHFVVKVSGDPLRDAEPAHFTRVAVVATDKNDYQPGETAKQSRINCQY
jgi:hypothetical protein